MKSAYAGVTNWVHFHAGMVWEELQLCNQGWVEPSASAFMSIPKPAAEAPEELLFFNEEVSSAMWLMNLEHQALIGRTHELFGSRQRLALTGEIASVFEHKWSPRASLQLTLHSIGARMALLAEHGRDVDSHTRLLLHRHVTILQHLIVPALDTVLRKATDEIVAVLPPDGGPSARPVISQDELARLYRAFLPEGPRPHPDTFLKFALLEHA
jgi:hypothetical protein